MSTTTNILHHLLEDELTGSINVPVYQTSTFVQEAPGVNKGYDYARSNNPTRAVLESLVANLEGGAGASAFATGLAAIDAVLKLLKAGDEIIAVDDIYGGAFRLFTHIYEKFGIKVHYVDTTNPENITEYLNEKTKFIWIETPTNPTLKITDIRYVAALSRKYNPLIVVDNTFATPIGQKPFGYGADIVVHSATKYLAGHSDLVAGIVVSKTKELADEIKFIQNASGGILGPWDCFLTIRGIETLPLRFKKQCENGQAIAEFLCTCEDVDKVFYPGLKHHKNHEVAKQQQSGLYGGVVSFSLKEDTQEAAHTFVTSTKYFKLAESLGGVKSLLCHPAQMTHASIPREKRLQSGIQDSLIRLSCGIEESQDLIEDIKLAIAAIKQKQQNKIHA